MEENCIFCKIVNGTVPSKKVYEDKDIVAFFPKEMEARGHTLVIPKSHYSNLFDILDVDLKKLILVVKKLSKKIKSNLGAEGINLLHASGEIAQQSVPHFHIHIIPRFKGDGIDAWIKKNNEEIFNLEDIQNKIISGDKNIILN
jgi:histidine triad (HIT) family protein